MLFRSKHLGKAFGFHLLAGNLGFAIAPLLMAALAAGFGWRTALMVVGGFGLATAVAMVLFGHNLRAAATDGGKGAKKEGGAQTLVSPALLMMLAFFILMALANSGIQTFSVTVFALNGVSLTDANTVLTVFLTAGFVGIAAGGVVADRITRPIGVVVVSMFVCALGLGIVGSGPLPYVAIVI